MPRTHYRRQKRWWSAYLLFYDRADQCPVFDGKAACLYIHVHVHVFMYVYVFYTGKYQDRLIYTYM